MISKNFHRLSKEAMPAFLILILSIAFSVLSGEFAFLRGWESLYRGLIRFFRTASFSLPSSRSIAIHLSQPRVFYLKKEEDIYSNKTKAKTGNSSHQALAFPPVSRDRHWTSFCHQTARSSSDRYRINSCGFHFFAPGAISTGTTFSSYGDHDSRLPRLIYSLDF